MNTTQNTNNVQSGNGNNQSQGLLTEVAIGEDLATCQLNENTMPNNEELKGK